MPPHVPTSVALMDEAPRDRVSLAWLIDRLQTRSFGILMLVLALLGLAPGIVIFVAFLLAFPAIQMILGRESPSFPRAISARSIPTRHFIRWSTRAIPLLVRIEALIRPRLHMPFQATKRLVGFIVLILAATLVWPLPFSHVIPALVIMLISLAYLEEDGILLCVALACALVSLFITAATMWATMRATGFIERMLIGG